MSTGVFDVHQQGQSVFDCGQINSENGFQLLEAFHFALQKVNSKQGQFADILPGVTLGGVGLDACQSSIRAGYLVSNINSGLTRLVRDGRVSLSVCLSCLSVCLSVSAYLSVCLSVAIGTLLWERQVWVTVRIPSVKVISSHKSTKGRWEGVRECVCVWVHVCMHVCICLWEEFVSVSVCVCEGMSECECRLCACMHVCVCVCVCVHVWVHLCQGLGLDACQSPMRADYLTSKINNRMTDLLCCHCLLVGWSSHWIYFAQLIFKGENSSWLIFMKFTFSIGLCLEAYEPISFKCDVMM